MAYSSLDKLPAAIRSMPEPAQELYIRTFNAAWEAYRSGSDAQDDSSQEETAHRQAWAAVRKKYKRYNSVWINKEG